MADYRLYIDGAFHDAVSGATAETADPSTGETIGTYAVAGAGDADLAVRAARTAYDDGRWSSLSANDRGEVLTSVAAAIRARGAELAELESRDAGATAAKAKVDVSSGAFWFRTMADSARRFDELEPLPLTLAPVASANYLRRESIGVCVAIVPWNFPFLMACWKISMALAAGNTLVLKPAPETPASAAVLAGILHEAGVPAGVVNVLPGPGPGLGDVLVEHPLVDKVSFTGSVGVGRKIARDAGAGLKRVTLELGGKSAQIVLDDADLDLAVDGALHAGFFHAGQACTAGSRILVRDSLYSEFVARLTARAATIVVGPRSDPRATVGPLINLQQFERVQSYVDIGIAEGATVLLGGHRVKSSETDRGYFMSPTIFGDVTPAMRIAQEEIFGPVLCVLRYTSVDEAVEIANGTPYGLAAGVWGPPGPAAEVAAALRAGTVWVNDYHLLSPKYPFGGMKQSGIGREHGTIGLDEWTEVKHVHVALDSRRTSKRSFDLTVPLAERR